MAPLPTCFVQLSDLKVAYCEAGTGPNLLFLHGNSESKRIFTHFQTVFFTDFHTYALDSRAHGESQSVDSALSIPQFCEDVIHFCEAKGITRTSLVGYSDGGNIALLLAKNAPQLFDRIVSISPNYLASGTDEKTLRLFQRMQRCWKFLGRLGLPVKTILMRYDLMLKDIGITAEELRTIRTGMKILYAEKAMIKPEHIQEIAALIPDSHLEQIANCTHMNILKQQQTVRAIRDYLTEK
jgi:pimeloyl-ACP methyl ester carboxylesterase